MTHVDMAVLIMGSADDIQDMIPSVDQQKRIFDIETREWRRPSKGDMVLRLVGGGYALVPYDVVPQVARDFGIGEFMGHG